MHLFLKLFGPYLQWVYHCFDRIVITGHLLGLLRENQVVYFFQQVCGHPKLTQDLLRQRTRDYQQWVQHFARNHRLPLEWYSVRSFETASVPLVSVEMIPSISFTCAARAFSTFSRAS